MQPIDATGDFRRLKKKYTIVFSTPFILFLLWLTSIAVLVSKTTNTSYIESLHLYFFEKHVSTAGTLLQAAHPSLYNLTQWLLVITVVSVPISMLIFILIWKCPNCHYPLPHNRQKSLLSLLNEVWHWKHYSYAPKQCPHCTAILINEGFG